MSEASKPPLSGDEIDREDDRPEISAGSRVALGSLARAGGEAVAKIASLAFYLVLARELGEASYGDFIFGLSLAQVLLVFAALGGDELIAREVARDRGAVDSIFPNIVAIKALSLAVLWLVMAAVVLLGDYSSESTIAMLLVGLGVVGERQMRNYLAIFQAFEVNQFVALSLISARFFTATAGVTALLLGAGLVPAAAIFSSGSATGMLVARFSMKRWVVTPSGAIDTSRWPDLMRAAIPLGLVTVIYLLLVRLDSTMLGLLADGSDNSEVGIYGAAHRLVESTMFLSWAIGGAMLPWLARHNDETPVSLVRGYEIGLKVLVAALLPIATGFIVLAEPLIELLYTAEYADSANVLRFLAMMTVLFGINTFVGILMISRDRPGEFTRPSIVILVQNITFNLVLIPKYGASGAAFNAVFSGFILAVWTFIKARRLFGPISPVRVLLGPVVASGCLFGVLSAFGAELSPLSLAVGTITYPTAFLLFERFAFPDDFVFFRRIASR